MTDKIARVCTIGFALAIVALWSHGAAAHGVTIKVEHPLPADSPLHTAFLIPWTQKVEKESGGRLHFQLYPAIQLSTESQLFDRVRSGEVEMIWASADADARFTSLDVLTVPFMTNSTQGTTRALWEYVRMSDQAHLACCPINNLPKT